LSRQEIPAISAISPTLAETMRLCHLRAGISKIGAISSLTLGNPKAWLGTAYHEVLEKIVDVDLQLEDLESAAARLWDQAIRDQHQRNLHHPLNCRFGPPETWPGFHMVRASALVRVRELAGGTASFSAEGPDHAGTKCGGIIRERSFAAFDGRLVGRPDVIRGREIIDYKSGTIMEVDEVAQTDVVKAAYVRQLRIYGFVVRETLGRWPERGVLLPFVGPSVEVPLNPTDCTREATEAIELLDAYNSKLESGMPVSELATPSPAVCKWCPFKLLCVAFWRAASSAWSGNLDGAAIEGHLAEEPRTIHAGAAFAVSLDVSAGSETLERKQVTPLNPNVHPIVGSLSAGDHIRFVGLHARPDGVLVPTQRTIIAKVNDLPDVVVPVERN
jgi:hypothetical protein